MHTRTQIKIDKHTHMHLDIHRDKVYTHKKTDSDVNIHTHMLTHLHIDAERMTHKSIKTKIY